MKKIFLVLSVLFYGLTTVFAQNYIEWKQESALQFSDFQGSPDYSLTYTAFAYWNIKYQYKWKFVNSKMQVSFSVFCNFNKDKSWKKDGKLNAILLKHENVHFDIAELYSRKLRKRLWEYNFTKDNIDNEFKTIYNDVHEECKIFQEMYDTSTKHALNTEQQEFWNSYISSELSRYAQYAQVYYQNY